MFTRTRLTRPSSRKTATRSTPGMVESCERRILFAIDVTVGVGAPSSTLVFTDADGTIAQIRVAGGAATFTFDGTTVAQSTSGRLTTVSGTGVSLTNAVLTGANPNVAFRTASGDGRIVLGALSAAGPVGAFSGRGVVLAGPATLSNGIGVLDLAGASGATVTINRSGQARLQDASISIIGVADTTITSQQPLRQLRVATWSAGPAGQQPDQVIAPRINVLQCAGDFGADVTLSGNGQVVGRPVLGSVKVLGALTSGVWNVAGKTGRIAAGSVGPTWAGTFGDVANITAGDVSGSITADSIGALNANTISNAGITLNRPFAPGATALGRLNVRGAINNSAVRSAADIGTVSAASINGTLIYAGISSSVGEALPANAAAFVTAATIRGVTIRNQGTTASFINSRIAASTLGRMSLGTAQVNNGGSPFGIAAQSIASASGRRDDTGETARVARLTDPSDSIVAVDLQVRVF